MDRAPSPRSAAAWGVLCGTGAAFFWALGFVAARQGIEAGLSPFVIALDRFVWPGLALLPVVAADGFRDLGGLGWRRAAMLALFGGLPLALLAYIGYVFVPLGHGGVIQPSCAALGGLILARLVQGAAAAAADCRCAVDRRRPCRDRQRGGAHHGPARHPRRFAVRGGGMLLCDVRDPGAALADRPAAGRGDHQRAVAHRPAAPIARRRQIVRLEL